MSASTDQDLIVETVIKAFFFVPNQAKGLDKLKPAVLSFAEGRVNTATARCDLRAALAGMGHEAYEDKLDCCLETAHAFVCGHVHWLNAQMNMDAYPACELCQMFQRDEIVDWKLRW